MLASCVAHDRFVSSSVCGRVSYSKKGTGQAQQVPSGIRGVRSQTCQARPTRLSHRRPFIRPDPLMFDTEVDLEPPVSPLSAYTALPEAMLCSYDG